MLHGTIDMNGAVPSLRDNPNRSGIEWIIRIVPATSYSSFECGVHSHELVREKFFQHFCVLIKYQNYFRQMIGLKQFKKLFKKHLDVKINIVKWKDAIK